MGTGIVGGSLTDFDNNAQRLGKLLGLILAGKNPDEIPVAPPAPTVPTVDWRQLARWGFDEAGLPPGAVVLFRQATLWQAYRWQIVGAATVIAIETLLIVALLAQRRRRKRVESAMTAQNLTLAHASEDSKADLKRELDVSRSKFNTIKNQARCHGPRSQRPPERRRHNSPKTKAQEISQEGRSQIAILANLTMHRFPSVRT